MHIVIYKLRRLNPKNNKVYYPCFNVKIIKNKHDRKVIVKIQSKTNVLIFVHLAYLFNTSYEYLTKVKGSINGNNVIGNMITSLTRNTKAALNS